MKQERSEYLVATSLESGRKLCSTDYKEYSVLLTKKNIDTRVTVKNGGRITKDKTGYNS